MDKALRVLALVADGVRTLGELSDHSGLPKSTVHRLTGVLVDHGFLARVSGHRFRLGHRLMELGERAKEQVPLPRIARRHMEALSAATRETIHLGELVGRDIVYLEKVEGARGLQMRSRVGLASTASTTAMGKVTIAHQPEAQWADYFTGGPARTPNSIVSGEAFEAELRAVRARGYAFDRQENEEGICCIAAPIRDASGRVVAAISLTGAVIFLPDARLGELAPRVVACADAISRDLGARLTGDA